MSKFTVLNSFYKNIAKPVLFSFDPEFVHEAFLKTGNTLGKFSSGKKLAQSLFTFENSLLKNTVNDVTFYNPIGLAAGFDYDGYLADFLFYCGFGFNTVGTVTALDYEGNTKPRLVRLPESKSILVNKGFKSEGSKVVENRLDQMFSNSIESKQVVGLSIGSTNIESISTIDKAIADYVTSFKIFKDKEYIKYLELNISCPNTLLKESFSNVHNYKKLLKELSKLNIKKPIFLKMPNEISEQNLFELIDVSIENNIKTFILSNLAKNRKKVSVTKTELNKVKNLKGNFSGKPTQKNANSLISACYKRYKTNINIVGCGGVFSAEDAYEKIKSGASLVQLITGLIYEGPQLIGQINEDLVQLLKKDGYSSISEAVGAFHK